MIDVLPLYGSTPFEIISTKREARTGDGQCFTNSDKPKYGLALMPGTESGMRSCLATAS